MGSDNLSYFHTWDGYREILSGFKIVVVGRNGDSPEKIIESNPLLSLYKDRFVIIHPSVRNDGNSTFVRKLLKEGKSIRYLVPDEVYFYLKQNNLFQKGA